MTVTAAATAKKLELEIQFLPIDKLRPDPNNPRKVFKAIDELAENIKLNGVKDPLRARPIADRKDEFFIVFGERRWRAAKKIGLTHLPALVEVLSDEQALELMLLELAQRSDVHPVEEAEAYKTLRDVHKLSVAEIAAKVGRPVGTVYERLKLCELAPEVRKAALAGELPASHAVLIARIPDQRLQAEALKGLKSYDGGYVSYRDAVDRIHRTYMLQLKNAPFDIADAKLLPAAGACATCPKRTGNQRELFADVKSPDVCTDPSCYGKKVQAKADSELKKEEEKGKEVLRGERAEKLFERQYDGTHDLKRGSGYVPLGDGREYIDGRGYVDVKAAVKKHGIKTVLVADPDSGKTIELAPVRALPKPKEKAGHNYKEQEKRRAEKAQQRTAFARSIIGPLVARYEKALGKPELIALVAALLAERGSYSTSELLARRAGKELGYAQEEKAFEDLRKSLPKKSEAELRGLLFELMVSTHMTAEYLGKQEPEGALVVAAQALGVDVRAERKKFDEAQKAPAPTSAAKKTPAAEPRVKKVKPAPKAAGKKKPGKKK